jgi:hypothetical protein
VSRRRIRRLFLVLLVLLPAQYAAVLACEYVYGIELWPALVLPSFGRVYGDADAITVDTPEMTAAFADGTEASVELAALLEQLPVSHRRTVLRRAFPLPSAGDAPVVPADTRAWLGDRLHRLFPDRRVQAFRVEWVRYAYPVASGASVQRQPLGTVAIDLDAP